MSFFSWLESLFQKNNPHPPIVPLPAPASQPTESGRVMGVDVSHYQGPIDWTALYAIGYRFAFAKATDGARGVDSMFAKHRASAKTAGFIFGAYHFYRFNDKPYDQMVNFIQVAGLGNIPGELPPTIDVEWDNEPGSPYGDGKQMDAAAAESVYAAAVMLQQQMSGAFPIIYTNYYFFNPGTRGSFFTRCPLWVPAYKTTSDKIKISPPWGKVSFWQDSENYSIEGVGGIDTNVFFGTLDELKKMALK